MHPQALYTEIVKISLKENQVLTPKKYMVYQKN